jgi:DNA helicase II / ATP-dependent DNA helicase PcrA
MELLLEALTKKLRNGQKIISEWSGGEMAISAVPGAGKSYCLAVGTALAIAKNDLHPKKQLLIVTYTRSAAISIKTKINQILKEDLQGILGPQAYGSFIVQTIHGLALNIASRYRELAQIDLENSTLIIPTPSHKIIRNTVENWLTKNEFVYQNLLQGKEKYDEETEKLGRQMTLRTDILPNLAFTVIKEAKSSGLLPEELKEISKQIQEEFNILEIGAQLYQEYEILRKNGNYIDYEDLILAALNVLKNPKILKTCQEDFFAIFEDEAQDSSPLQGKLLALLAANSANNNQINLVRVGDPNQAINSTFTPADPVYFNRFCDNCQAKNSLSTMDEADRSNSMIIRTANFLVRWLKSKKIDFREQFIQEVIDTNTRKSSNPDAEGKGVELEFPNNIYDTVKLIGDRVKFLLKNNPDKRAAILVRENAQGRFLAEKLAYLQQEEGINIYEVGEIERQTKIPEEMLNLLRFIHRPHSSDNLKSALEVLKNRQKIRVEDINSLVIFPENFIYPIRPKSEEKSSLKEARLLLKKLLKAQLELPTNDLIPFLGMTLGYEGGELATNQKLSETINQQIMGNNSLKNIINILEDIVMYQRFEIVEEENDNKLLKPNQLTIITMHKSKGLDWDYVFIPFLNEKVLSGKCFVGKNKNFLGEINLDQVARNQIRDFNNNYQQIPNYQTAWKEVNKLKQGEEYRLLYVAITRAKSLLWLSSEKNLPFQWKSFNGENNDSLTTQESCLFLEKLQEKLAKI